jgi:hypothetical protein
LKSFRRKIAKEGVLKYDVEFHCSELIDPHKIKEYNQISVRDRWMLIDEFAQTIGNYGNFHLIAIVIDKKQTKLKPEDYHTTALTKLYQHFDFFLKNSKQFGIVFLDRTNERKLATHVRTLLQTGNTHSKTDMPLHWILEDPIFKNSADSIFIQAADVVAYSLKEQEFPRASKKKFLADRIFGKQLEKRFFANKSIGKNGIIRL